MIKPLAAAVLLAGAAGGTAAGVYFAVPRTEEEVLPRQAEQATPTDSAAATPRAEGRVVRWVNVTVTIPEGSSVIAIQGFPGFGVQAIELDPGPFTITGVAINAETGAILEDNVRPEDRAAMDAVLATLTVSPFDPATLPWPYNGEPPAVPRVTRGRISYIPPDASSGIRIEPEIALSTGEPYSGIDVSNGRSIIKVNVRTGAVAILLMHPDDEEAFNRFIGAVQPAGP